MRITQAIWLQSPSNYTSAILILSRKGLNSLFCKGNRVNKNQIFKTKSIAASSSYLEGAITGEEIALILLVIDLQRQFGDSSLQLTKSERAQMGLYVNQTAQYSFKFPLEFGDFWIC